ncbi:MAG TPA: hypothetical protein VNT79_00795 [Phycisphaerae bacterium]|nr:hypothetical protein [Phycisphaerae bacterium]
MSRTAAEYLEEAAECRRVATTQTKQEMREAWLMMASAFEVVAERQSLRERDEHLNASAAVDASKCVKSSQSTMQ